jgi:hypothetical protein
MEKRLLYDPRDSLVVFYQFGYLKAFHMKNLELAAFANGHIQQFGKSIPNLVFRHDGKKQCNNSLSYS